VASQRYTEYLSEAEPANPFDDVVGGSLLGPKHFIEWVRVTFLSGKKTDREIPQLKELKPRPEAETIVEEVAKHFKVTPEHILISGRKRNIWRDVAIYLSRELSGLGGQHLGRYFGGISGANITMRFNCIARSLKNDRKLAKDIAYLRNKITNS
jgi:chromosomal replication initiation ATPase DnaA